MNHKSGNLSTRRKYRPLLTPTTNSHTLPFHIFSGNTENDGTDGGSHDKREVWYDSGETADLYHEEHNKERDLPPMRCRSNVRWFFPGVTNPERESSFKTKLPAKTKGARCVWVRASASVCANVNICCRKLDIFKPRSFSASTLYFPMNFFWITQGFHPFLAIFIASSFHFSYLCVYFCALCASERKELAIYLMKVQQFVLITNW